MKIVTDISPMNKSRYKVDINGCFSFILYKNELFRYGIRIGEELSEEVHDEIMETVLPRRAKLRCMNLLKSREYTEYQLREKLRQGFYPKKVIEEAIDYVKSFRYVDDRQYTKNYIVYYSESRSKGRIEQDLMRKGVDRELIREVYRSELREEKLPDEKQLMEKLLEKKHYNKAAADYGSRQKMASYLYRKGFSADSICEVI